LPERMQYIVEQIYFEDRSVTSLADELQTTHAAVSQQRAEAMPLLRDGVNTYDGPSAPSPAKAHSRVSASRLASYFTNVSALTAGGISRNAAALPYEAAV
jgi:RNA polymerase sigma factor for flagellar operon FliA